MEVDFWSETLGGKDDLKLFMNAKKFRTRKNKYSKVASFIFGIDGENKIAIHYKSIGSGSMHRVDLFKNGRFESQCYCSQENLRFTLTLMTGFVLEF